MHQAQPIQLRKVRDIGEVLTATLVFLREHYTPLGKAMLAIVGPAMLVSTIIGAVMQSTMYSAILEASSYDIYDEAYSDSALAMFGSGFVMSAFLLMILSVVIFTLATAVVYSYMTLYMDDGEAKLNTRGIWNETKSNFGRLLATFIVIGILLFVGAFFSLVIPLLGLLAFFIGGTYVTVAMAFVGIIRVREEGGIFNAISRSFELIRNNWWRTAILLFVIYVMVTSVLSLLLIPQYVIIGMLSAHSLEEGDPSGFLGTVMTVLSVASSIGMFILYPLPLVAVAIQYFSLVEEKEGIGLRERIDEFGTHLQSATHYEERY